MELITYTNRPSPRAVVSSVGGGFTREEIRSGCISKVDDVLRLDDRPFYWWDEQIRDDLSTWIDILNNTEDVPELPPAKIVEYRDLLEKGWGWQRVAPYAPGNVGWKIFKGYLKEFLIQNTGEIAALCANKKPENDKAFFCALAARKKRNQEKGSRSRNAGAVASRCANKKPDIGIVSSTILRVAAEMCIEMEYDFCRGANRTLLTAEDISLSNQIMERADLVIQSAGEYSIAAAALVCITKETELLYELFECDFDTTNMIAFSKKVKLLALNFVLHNGLESAAAAGAMVGMAKEAKFLRYVLSRVDRHMYLDYFLCDTIRRDTAKALTTLLKESGIAVLEEYDKAQDQGHEKLEIIVGETVCNDQRCGEIVNETDYRVQQLGKTADETERKDQQLGKVAALANSGLARLNRGDKLSNEEMEEYLLNFIRLATE